MCLVEERFWEYKIFYNKSFQKYVNRFLSISHFIFCKLLPRYQGLILVKTFQIVPSIALPLQKDDQEPKQ